jgi:hypothetical protein
MNPKIIAVDFDGTIMGNDKTAKMTTEKRKIEPFIPIKDLDDFLELVAFLLSKDDSHIKYLCEYVRRLLEEDFYIIPESYKEWFDRGLYRYVDFKFLSEQMQDYLKEKFGKKEVEYFLKKPKYLTLSFQKPSGLIHKEEHYYNTFRFANLQIRKTLLNRINKNYTLLDYKFEELNNKEYVSIEDEFREYNEDLYLRDNKNLDRSDFLFNIAEFYEHQIKKFRQQTVE